MKKILRLSSLALIALIMACGSPANDKNDDKKALSIKVMDQDQLKEEIANREAALNADTLQMNKQTAARLMEAYATYSKRFPHYEESPDYLFKAGEIAMGLGHSIEAIKYFERVYAEYDRYDKHPFSLFMKAYILENQIGEYDQAKAIYEQFLEEFPNHEMAADAKFSIKNLGKTPEELIREFEIKDSLDKVNQAS